MDAAEIERRLSRHLAMSPAECVAVYLFGSVARGTATGSSDVDLAVLTSGIAPDRAEWFRLELEGELERLLGMRVDLVLLDRAPVDLVHRVLRDGRLLLERDPSLRVRFEVKARNEFFDLQPHLFEYRRAAR